MDRELILAELVSRCEKEIEMWGFRSAWCLEKIDKNRCPAEFADDELCRDIEGVIEDWVSEQEDEIGAREFVDENITYDDILFY